MSAASRKLPELPIVTQYAELFSQWDYQGSTPPVKSLRHNIAGFAGYKLWRINPEQRGLLFRDNGFVAILPPGKHWIKDWDNRVTVDIVSILSPLLKHPKLESVYVGAQSQKNDTDLNFLQVEVNQRVLFWVDNVLAAVLCPGLHAWWKNSRKVRTEVIDIAINDGRLEHAKFSYLANCGLITKLVNSTIIENNYQGLLFVDNKYKKTLPPGHYLYWRGAVDSKIVKVNLAEIVLDIAGQEILTSDKVTLRLNAVLTYKIADSIKYVTVSDSPEQAIYRDAQLALRSVVGTRQLDNLLEDKDALATELLPQLQKMGEKYGLEITNFGVRDIILPGEMKNILNKVTEAKKAAEASIIQRREETAAMRHQLNTAKLFTDNPTLLRLRELEIIERIANSGQLKVLLSEKKLDQVISNLL